MASFTHIENKLYTCTQDLFTNFPKKEVGRVDDGDEKDIEHYNNIVKKARTKEYRIRNLHATC